MSSLRAHVAVQQGVKLLAERAEEIRPRLPREPALWGEYCDLLRTLAAILPVTAPEATGALLTTAEMAERLGIAPKTLLRRKARGEIRPALERGKLLRWTGTERL